MFIKNVKNEQRLELTFISGEQAVDGAIRCLLSVYGEDENYVNPQVLDRNFLLEKVRGGDVKVFAGNSEDGTTACALAVKKNTYFEKALEIFALAVNPAYRGFNLGDVVTEYVVAVCVNAGDSPLYAHLVMFHKQVGAIYEKNGFIPTGFLLGVCDARKHLSQLNCASQKHSWAIYVRNNGTVEPGTIYIPAQLTAVVAAIYQRLGAVPAICGQGPGASHASRLEYEQDDVHKTLYIYVLTSGEDLQAQVEKAERRYTDGLQTAVLFLNINDPGAIGGYASLLACGYAFAGLKPLCGAHEYLILSKTSGVVIDSDEFHMTALLLNLFERVGELR